MKDAIICNVNVDINNIDWLLSDCNKYADYVGVRDVIADKTRLAQKNLDVRCETLEQLKASGLADEDKLQIEESAIKADSEKLERLIEDGKDVVKLYRTSYSETMTGLVKVIVADIPNDDKIQKIATVFNVKTAQAERLLCGLYGIQATSRKARAGIKIVDKVETFTGKRSYTKNMTGKKVETNIILFGLQKMEKAGLVPTFNYASFKDMDLSSVLETFKADKADKA